MSESTLNEGNNSKTNNSSTENEKKNEFQKIVKELSESRRKRVELEIQLKSREAQLEMMATHLAEYNSSLLNAVESNTDRELHIDYLTEQLHNKEAILRIELQEKERIFDNLQEFDRENKSLKEEVEKHKEVRRISETGNYYDNLMYLYNEREKSKKKPSNTSTDILQEIRKNMKEQEILDTYSIICKKLDCI